MSAPRKDSRKSDLRQDERMVRELQAWLKANVSSKVLEGRLQSDRTLLMMVKQAFIAGWRSKNLKQHEPTIGMMTNDIEGECLFQNSYAGRRRKAREDLEWAADTMRQGR